MVEPIVYNVMFDLSQLLENNEVNFLEEDKEEVRSLRDEFEYLNILIHSYEGKSDNHNIMVPLDQIMDVARKVEDILDRYFKNVAKQKRRNKVGKLFLGSTQATMLHDLSEKITKFQTTITDIYNYHIQQKGINEEAYQFQKVYVTRKPKAQVVNYADADVVGLDDEATTLVNMLVEGTEELDVIAIFGMGGVGKTTLAKKVYNNLFVKDRFRFRAWVYVSQEYVLKELLLEILKGITPMTAEMISMMKEEQLKQEVKKQLSHHMYLVVLDDVWEKRDWDELKGVFPNDRNRSRVVITTRNLKVARNASENSLLQVRLLNEVESWELFTNKVFSGEPCPAELVPLGRDMVAKCAGLPLAIVVLGGLLAPKQKNMHNWKAILGNISTSLQLTTPLDILSLSYDELPTYLKPCFLYLGLFPEDHKISAKQLIQLWIAEGFVQKEDEEMHKKEDVAEDYLHQLIDRSLIQVYERRSDGTVKTCLCHDLIHDLCLKLSQKEKFLASHSSVVPTSQNEARRLSIHCNRGDYILEANPSNTGHVRTLLFFNQDELSKEHWKIFFKCFEFLRVLELGEVQMLPKAIYNLIRLKYLRVKTADIAGGIPTTICDLEQLLTLDLRRSRINVLPKEIWSMQQLRHLYLDGSNRLPENAGTNCLFNLQTLCYISQDPAGLVKIAEKAPNLRKLGLYGYLCNSSDEQESTFNLPYLKSLKFTKECTFNKPIELPSAITKIDIKDVYLEPKTIEMFQNLPRLEILKLDGASFHNDELVFGEGWFSELKSLKIANSSIKTWKLGPRAVEKLKRVVVSKCPGLRMLPEELWNITTLQELELLSLPDSLTKKIGKLKKSKLKVVISSPAPRDPDAASS